MKTKQTNMKTKQTKNKKKQKKKTPVFVKTNVLFYCMSDIGKPAYTIFNECTSIHAR